MTLAACREPILEPRELPKGVEVAELAFHRTNWFECAVAVYRLQADFADRIRTNGLGAFRDGPDGTKWKPTPTPDRIDIYDMSKETANLSATFDCLKGAEPYSSIFMRASERGGYYIQSDNGGTDIIAPVEGLIMIGGYE